MSCTNDVCRITDFLYPTEMGLVVREISAVNIQTLQLLLVIVLKIFRDM